LRVGPQGADFLREHIDDIADLTWGDMRLEHLEHGACSIFRIDRACGREVGGDRGEEIIE